VFSTSSYFLPGKKKAERNPVRSILHDGDDDDDDDAPSKKMKEG
jgi:hypothetical protein